MGKLMFTSPLYPVYHAEDHLTVQRLTADDLTKTYVYFYYCCRRT